MFRSSPTRNRRKNPKPSHHRCPTPTTQQRERSGASIGSDLPPPGASALKLLLPQASLRAQDRSRCPTPAHSAAGTVRSKHRKRSPLSRRVSAKAPPPPSFPASAGSFPLPHTNHSAAGTVRSKHWKRSTLLSATVTSPSGQPTLNRPSGWLISLLVAFCMSGAVAMNVTLAPGASLGRIAEIFRNAVLFGPDDSRGPH
jgi:hypothetical protein